MNILVLVAGTNEPSNAATLADAFCAGIRAKADANIRTLRLRDLQIEHFTLDHYDATRKTDDDFHVLHDACKDMHGLVIATPVWNFSVPAHLKNAIDRMGAFALDAEGHSRGQLKKLPVYLVYTGGAPLIAWRALMYLTTLHVSEAFKYYGATILGKYYEPSCVLGRGKFGLVVHERPKSLAAVRKAGERFGAAAATYAQNGTLPARARLGQQLFSFLYRVGNRIMYPIATRQ